MTVSDRTEVFVYEGEPGEKTRLDIFLANKLPEFSRSRLQGLIRDGNVSINKQPLTKAGRWLDAGEIIEVHIPPPVPSMLVPEKRPLDIVYEDSNLVIINKPAGMVVHPSPGHTAGTLVHAVLGLIPDLGGIGGEERPGIVHRLDKDTSGLIVVAKNEPAHTWLQDQFRNRAVEKIYLALVDGHPPTETGRIEAAIGRNSSHRKLMGVVPDDKGREAITEYRTLEKFTDQTLLEVHPHTGRTHQIRVHMAFLGCPISGDTVYGRKKRTLPIARHFLHAWKLKITLPGADKQREFEALVPDDLSQTLKALRQKPE